jgi:small conductance mechanosensitive channel
MMFQREFSLSVDTLLLSYLIDGTIGILLLAGGWLLTAWAARVAGRALDRTGRIDPTLRPIIVSTVRYVVFIMVMIAALARLGIQTASVLAVIGAAGLAIALALQGTLSNVASGLMLLFLRPFGVGDDVECDGVVGTVREVGLFATEFETADGLYVLVPNTQLFGKPMKNFSRLPFRRVDLKFGTSYAEDTGKVIDLALSVLKADPRVLTIKPANAYVSNLGPQSIELTMTCWTRREDYFSLLRDLQRTVKERFAAEGISIPLPPQDVRIISQK